MSDLHIDYDYTPGMSNVCTRPICCRTESGVPTNSSNAAGKWGDYKCDLNERMMLDFFAHLRTMNPDAVIWAGDSIPHNVPTLNFQSNVDIMKNITR